MQMHCIVAHQNFVLYGLSRSISIPLSSPTLLVALSLHSYHSNQNTHTRIWPYIARTYINVKKGGSFRSSSTNLLAIARAFAFLLASYRLRERSKNLSFWCVCVSELHLAFGVLGREIEMDMNSGWLGFSLSSSSARGYGDGCGEGNGGGDGDGSCSSPVAASPLVAMPLHSDGSVHYDAPGMIEYDS